MGSRIASVHVHLPLTEDHQGPLDRHRVSLTHSEKKRKERVTSGLDERPHTHTIACIAHVRCACAPTYKTFPRLKGSKPIIACSVSKSEPKST